MQTEILSTETSDFLKQLFFLTSFNSSVLQVNIIFRKAEWAFIRIITVCIPTLFKDCLPHLFHRFKNRHLTKFRKTICYTFIVNYTCCEKMHGFSINMR